MGLKKKIIPLMLAAFAATALPSNGALAQEALPVPPNHASDTVRLVRQIHLAYVTGPSQRVNDQARAGLQNLAGALIRSTSVEPAGVIAIDIENDDISLLPFIYWPVTADAQPLSEAAQRKVQNYLNTGGMIVFDILDLNAGLGNESPLRRMLGNISLRRLVPMEEGHTLTRSFYLVSRLRGSFDFNDVWVEEPGEQGTETVSSVLIGENNWAGAWAGLTLTPNSREREMSLRAGINMVLYALTGQYKADQVHLPSILEKLERRR